MNLAETLENWSDVLLGSATALFTRVAEQLPNLIGAFVLIVLGWFVAKLCRGVTRKLFSWSGVEKAIGKSRINDTFKSIGVSTSVSSLVSHIIFWVVFLIFLVSASEVVGLSIVLSTLNRIILYIPNIIAAIAVIVLSLFVARFVKDLVAVGLGQVHMIYAAPLARLVELLIIIFGLTVAMTQLGFDIGILTANITLFIGGFVATMVLSLGLGAKNVVQNLLAGYYVRQLFRTDQEVTLLGEKGRVKQIHNLAVVIETEDGEVTLPNHKIIENGSFK